MDKKNIQKLIIMFALVFVVGFGFLIGYYFYYSEKTEERQISNQTPTKNLEKTLDDLTKENESNLNSTKQNDSEQKNSEDLESMDDYKNYVNEQLNVSSSETEDEINKIYKETIQKIRISAIGMDFNGAAEIANKTLSEHVFENGEQYSTLSNISFIYGLQNMKGEEKFTSVNLINDPVVYMSAFYSMEPEYQIEVLKNEEYIYVPINDSNQPSLLSVEEGGAAESRASEFFSDLTTCNITKIKIEVAGTSYYVYVVGKNGYSYRITNIETADKTINTRTTYSDYFRMWGRKDITIKSF